MSDSDTLARLERWYEAHCDGDWEHGDPIEIATLDNPGWRVRIPLAGTGLDSLPFDRVKIERDEDDWVHAWVESNEWNATAGPPNLREALNLFLDWATTEFG